MPSRQTHNFPTPHQQFQNGHPPPHHHASSPTVSQPLTQHDLNFSVIKRHLPALEAIVAKVSHTTIYAYSPALATWEKSNIEGCLFLLRLSPLLVVAPQNNNTNNTDPTRTQGRRPRYALFLLNRRYLSTWAISLTNPAGIDLTGPIIQLRAQATITDAADGTFGTSAASDPVAVRSGGDEEKIWGVWVYEDNGGSTQNERAELDAAILACIAGDGA